jgi:hypothetical protein
VLFHVEGLHGVELAVQQDPDETSVFATSSGRGHGVTPRTTTFDCEIVFITRLPYDDDIR